jgi:TonB family protein
MLILKFLVLGMFFCAPQTDGSDVSYSGPGVVNPKLAYKEEPSYSESAKRAGLQGDVLMALTIDENGTPRDALILSSLGQGLDEQAVSCVSRWRFKPATKDGRPVKFRATIEISFRIAERTFDSKDELRRTSSEAVKTLLARQRDGRLLDDSVKIMQNLADGKLPAAEYVVALWQINGDVLPKDEAAGLERIQIAPKGGDPAALRFLGTAKMEGKLMPMDQKGGLAFLRKAAALGNTDAQFQLGSMYLAGDGVNADVHLARKYLQSCAQSGKVECQERIQKLSVVSPQSPK